MAFVLDGGKYFSRNLLLTTAQSAVTSPDRVWYQSLALPSKEKGKANAFTASSSPPVLRVVAQITSKSFKCLIESSPGIPWNRGSKFIRPDFNSKFLFSSAHLFQSNPGKVSHVG
ncbi:hypothetical protein PIB30_076063, partial [Stylosanthes scabra]|nr:hypothetical protein [Stylosanthes scabra]